MFDKSFLSMFFQNNPLLAAELARVEARKPLTALDTSRYQLATSSATPSSDEEWKAALDNAHAQLEHQRIRYRLASFALFGLLISFAHEGTTTSLCFNNTEAMRGEHITTCSKQMPRR